MEGSIEMEENFEGEIWKPYQNIFVSNFGRVKTKRNGISYGHYSGRTNALGKIYKQVFVSGKNKYIHRLVAELFIPKTDEDNKINRDFINHKDENPSNNHYENLEWVTNRENQLHGTCPERVSGKNCHMARKIGRFSKTGELLEEYHGGYKILISQGFNPFSIYQCCSGRYKTSHGFVWKYLDEKKNPLSR